MTRFRYYVATSLDGFIATEDDDLSWLLQFGFEQFQEHYDRFFADVGALVMGSTTYRWILDEGGPWAYGSLPTWVLTSREGLAVPEGADVRFVGGAVHDAIPRIRESAQGKDVWIVGGGPVVAQFGEADALDELLITVMPVTLGAGRALLPWRRTRPMRLVSATPLGETGAVELVYDLRD